MHCCTQLQSLRLLIRWFVLNAAIVQMFHLCSRGMSVFLFHVDFISSINLRLHHIFFFRYTPKKALIGNWLFASCGVTSKNLVAFAIESELSRRSRQIFRRSNPYSLWRKKKMWCNQAGGRKKLNKKNCKTSPDIRRWRKLRTTLEYLRSSGIRSTSAC